MIFFDKKYVQWSIVGIIFCIALFFSVYKLTNSPPVWYDEGFYEQAAMNLVRSGRWGIQTSPNTFQSLGTVTSGYSLLLPIALSFKLFGIGILQARSVMVGFILLFLISVFLYVKKEKGFYLAISSTALLATYPTLYGNGKTVLGEVPGLFYFVLSLIFLHSWVTQKTWKSALFSGLFLGFAMSAKLSFLLASLPLVIVFSVYLYVTQQSSIKKICIYLSAILFAVILWVQTQFGKEDSLHSFFITTFNHYDGSSSSSLLLRNIMRFFSEATPMYLFIMFGVWGVAMYIQWRKKNTPDVSELFAALFALLNLGIYLLSPGWYRYLFPAQAVTFIFFPSSLWFIISHYFKINNVRYALMSVAILFILFVQSYQVMFRSFVATYYDSNRTQINEISFSELPRDINYFVYNLPEIVIFLPNDLQYFQYLNSHPLYGIGKEQLAELSKGVPDAVIMYYETYKQNELLVKAYPYQKKITDRYILLLK